jgi:hypothetical protein
MEQKVGNKPREVLLSLLKMLFIPTLSLGDQISRICTYTKKLKCQLLLFPIPQIPRNQRPFLILPKNLNPSPILV